MTVGERGGTVGSLAEAERLHDQYKLEWRNRIKWRIVRQLVETGRFHAGDLVDLDIPDDCKNVVGSSIGAAVRKGIMLETGERRASTDRAGHGRRSAVYEINPAIIGALTGSYEAHRRREPAAEPEPLFDAGPLDRPAPVSHHLSEAA